MTVLLLTCVAESACTRSELPEMSGRADREVGVDTDHPDEGDLAAARRELSRLFMSGDTTRLRNGNLLYYTGDSDNIRLILETPHGQNAIDAEESEFFLDFHNLCEFVLVEDMETHLLFATGSNASHAPVSLLVDAGTGQRVRSLHGLR